MDALGPRTARWPTSISATDLKVQIVSKAPSGGSTLVTVSITAKSNLASNTLQVVYVLDATQHYGTGDQRLPPPGAAVQR